MAGERQVVTKRYALYCGDCCEVLPKLPAESVGFSVFSPPFADLYSYTDLDGDMGNCRSYEEFFEHFGFLVGELGRVMMPGRIVAMHCMDLPMAKSKEGYVGIRDFPGDLIRVFEGNGFTYHSRHCVWKDPLIAATRTHALGLAHKQIVKDSAGCRMGIADYVIAMKKKGDNPIPIPHPDGLCEYVGQREIPRHLSYYDGHSDPKTNKRSHWIWQRYASPVWDDIRQSRTLSYKSAKQGDDQKHICPLQLDVIERCMVLWSAPKDVVLTPFMGVGSEAYVAVKMGRKAVGIELKPSYFRTAVKNVESVGRKIGQGGNNGFVLENRRG